MCAASLMVEYVHCKDLIKSPSSAPYASKNMTWICSMKKWCHCRHDGMTVNGEADLINSSGIALSLFQSMGNITSYNKISLHLAHSNISRQIKFELFTT